jgi:DNA-binding NarL/FixJ family response regulator
MRIMIVDDHQIVREGLKAILQDDPDFEVVAESRQSRDSLSWRGEPTPILCCSMPACQASVAPTRAGS